MARKFQLGQIVEIVNTSKGSSRKFEVVKLYLYHGKFPHAVFKDCKSNRKYDRYIKTDKDGNEWCEYNLNTPYYEGNLKDFYA